MRDFVLAERVYLVPELRKRHYLIAEVTLADLDEVLVAGVALPVELGRVDILQAFEA